MKLYSPQDLAKRIPYSADYNNYTLRELLPRYTILKLFVDEKRTLCPLFLWAMEQLDYEFRASKPPQPKKRAARGLGGASTSRASVVKRQTPPWADLDAIEAVYIRARRMSGDRPGSYHVDHIIPLQGRLISGLHIANNLRIIPARYNLKKSNKHDAY